MGARVARSDKYLFRVRKDGSSAPQVWVPSCLNRVLLADWLRKKMTWLTLF